MNGWIGTKNDDYHRAHLFKHLISFILITKKHKMTTEIRQRFQESKKNYVAVEENMNIKWKERKKNNKNFNKNYLNKCNIIA